MGKYIDVVVSEVRQLTPRIREFLLTTPDRAPALPYGPGAHLEVHTGDERSGLVIRHYSLIGGSGGSDGSAGRDDPRHSYRIAVQREDHGGGSAYIHAHFEPGTRLRVAPPANNFPLDRRDRHSLLIAGGIGITPVFSMARSLARRGRDYSVAYAGREAAAMAYHDELAALAGPRARFHYSGSGARLDLQALLAAQPEGTTAYVCGPATMIEATHAAGAALGWAPGRVRSETFGVGRRGDERPFQVELRRSGRVVEVGADVSILDALTAAKVDVLWDCRRGECGLCPQTVIEADGPIEHRDRYLDEDERRRGDTLCICVSRIRGSRLVLDA